MKLLYLDCGMGAAGDMLTAALLELFDNREEILRELNGLGIPGVAYEAEPCVKCGITGTHIRVDIRGEAEGEHCHHHHAHGHSHRGMEEIGAIMESLKLPEQVAEDVRRVYRLIADAESRVHGAPVEQIHFHEVGTMDAIADVTAVCYLMRKLAPDRVAASPVHVGSGRVSCAHGLLPVPAPATALLLEGIPVYGGAVTGELCTPTGAALLRYFVSEFGDMPPMILEKTGYGMGRKDFPVANCLRAMLGSRENRGDRVVQLSCNVDDMTGEDLGFAMERLLEMGALDVFTQPIGMKKSRPGILLSLLCREEDRENMVRGIFAHTTTLGIREESVKRYTLDRHFETVESPWGTVGVKVSEGWGVARRKPEYEDLRRIAEEQGLPLETVRNSLK